MPGRDSLHRPAAFPLCPLMRRGGSPRQGRARCPPPVPAKAPAHNCHKRSLPPMPPAASMSAIFPPLTAGQQFFRVLTSWRIRLRRQNVRRFAGTGENAGIARARLAQIRPPRQKQQHPPQARTRRLPVVDPMAEPRKARAALPPVRPITAPVVRLHPAPALRRRVGRRLRAGHPQGEEAARGGKANVPLPGVPALNGRQPAPHGPALCAMVRRASPMPLSTLAPTIADC